MPIVKLYAKKDGSGIYILPTVFDEVRNQKRIDEIESQNDNEKEGN